MKTYIVKNTDLFHNKILYKEGATVSLSDKEADSLKHILEPCSTVSLDIPAEVVDNNPQTPVTSSNKPRRRGRKPNQPKAEV